MGFLLSKSMDANFKKQQEFMLHNARLQMERQILMQNQMRERQMAMQIAWSREFLKYFGTFFTVATVGLGVGAVKRKKPALLAPVIPLSFVLAYQMDSAYGTLLNRMKGKTISYIHLQVGIMFGVESILLNPPKHEVVSLNKLLQILEPFTETGLQGFHYYQMVIEQTSV
ncbi:uncharacterized protein V6R79_023545 [Siganus canaliculatus]